MVKAKVWVMAKRFHGAPKPSDFAIKEEELHAIKDGEAVCEALWWSVDPYNKAYMNTAEDGTPMIGFQVAKVVESKSSKFPVGSTIVNHAGWRTRSIVSEHEKMFPPYLFKDPSPLPLSAAVGVLGMPGMTAYFGLLDTCHPQAGETVLVNAAAGAVGSLVGQIAKIKGCKVIGYAGADDKIAWLKEIGFDHAYNYKKVDLDQTLKEAAPNGIDCFFDNVGGTFASTVYKHLNLDARICQCGAISQYNNTEEAKITDFRGMFIGKRVKMTGFHVSKYVSQWPKGIAEMSQWLKEGKLTFKETNYEGFENMPQALIDLLDGKNTGKVVIKA
jgi:prostaglandin reductase 1